jgi:hypothetical protein
MIRPAHNDPKTDKMNPDPEKRERENGSSQGRINHDSIVLLIFARENRDASIEDWLQERARARSNEAS